MAPSIDRTTTQIGLTYWSGSDLVVTIVTVVIATVTVAVIVVTVPAPIIVVIVAPVAPSTETPTVFAHQILIFRYLDQETPSDALDWNIERRQHEVTAYSSNHTNGATQESDV
jgi:hypothetical protein